MQAGLARKNSIIVSLHKLAFTTEVGEATVSAVFSAGYATV